MKINENYRVLIVDDETNNVDILSYILSPGYNIIVAKNGDDAIMMAQKHMPDLILLDIVMPDMTGYEVLSELKNSDITNGIPVIFITGLDSTEDEEKGLRMGAVDYITKPFNSAIVKARVSIHLQIVEYIRKIEHLGMIDTLTNIPNRRGFDNQIKVEWNRSMRGKLPLSVLMIDIDQFKFINETYGHIHGDIVLRNIAEIISRTLKRAADYVARWDGEEFVVLLPETKLSGALGIAEEIRVNVENTTIPCMDGLNTSVTISIGVNSVIPTIDSSVEEFILKTDNALYRAKNLGRNRVCVQREYP